VGLLTGNRGLTFPWSHSLARDVGARNSANRPPCPAPSRASARHDRPRLALRTSRRPHLRLRASKANPPGAEMRREKRNAKRFSLKPRPPTHFLKVPLKERVRFLPRPTPVPRVSQRAVPAPVRQSGGGGRTRVLSGELGTGPGAAGPATPAAPASTSFIDAACALRRDIDSVMAGPANDPAHRCAGTEAHPSPGAPGAAPRRTSEAQDARTEHGGDRDS